MAAENVPENRDTGLRLSFGNTIPAGFSVEPDLHIDNFLWGSAVRRQAPERLYIEHELSYRSLHQIRDFLVACYNALPVGGVLRIAETDFANPGSAYQAFIQGLNLRTPLDVGRLSALMAGAGFVVRGVEFHDGFGNFHGFRNELERNGFPARSRYKDGRGFDPEILYSSLVVDGYKQEAGPSPAFADAHLKFIALGDSHTRFLGGKDDIEDGENVPHTRQYKGFAAHFDAFHLGPGLAYNLDKSGSTTMILERVNALIDMGALPADRATVFSFGEIDCRSHVVRQAERQSRPIEAIVGDICGNYRNFLGMMLARGIQPAVWGPVASTPNQDYADPDAPAYGSIEQRNFAIARFNAEMRDICARMRLPFLSVADRLIGPDQKTRSEYYCDDIHLSQRARSLLWDLMPDGEMVPPPPAPPPELRVAAHAPIATDLKEIVTFKANGGWTWFQTSG